MHPCHPLEEVISSWPEKPAAYRYPINYTLLAFFIAVELLKRLNRLGIELKPIPRWGNWHLVNILGLLLLFSA